MICLLINFYFEIELDLSCSKNCIITEISRTLNIHPNPSNPPILSLRTTGVIFQMTNAKLYVPVVIFFINNNIKILENIKQGFKITISWNKYRSEITRYNPKAIVYIIVIDPI